MRRATLIGVGVLGLAVSSAFAGELDLTGERPPDTAPGAPCEQRLDSASASGPEALRALLLSARPPFPPAARETVLADEAAGRMDCEGTAEPDLPLASGPDASGRVVLGVPDGLDAACWDVALARGCSERRIPLHQLRVEREPGRFGAWLDTGPVRARRAAEAAAGTSGLRVLDSTLLVNLGGSLVRLAVDEGADPTLVQAALDKLKAEPELRHRAIVYRGAAASEPGWGARRIGADRLQLPARSAGVRVALVDSSAADLPELEGRIALARDLTGREPAAGLHGSALAGIVAAAGQAKLLSLAACRDEPGGDAARCWSSSLVRALDAAIGEKARIALLGWSGPDDALVARALERTAKRGVLLVAGVGDAGDERSPAFPASHAAVLGVTAVDRAGQAFGPTARGAAVGLAGPGVDLPLDTPGSSSPQSLSGSALAAAHVANAAALLLQLAPRATSQKLQETMTSTAVDLGEPGRDPVFGAGLVDVCAAARALLGSTEEDPCRAGP